MYQEMMRWMSRIMVVVLDGFVASMVGVWKNGANLGLVPATNPTHYEPHQPSKNESD
jgi:hypothetical protein